MATSEVTLVVARENILSEHLGAYFLIEHNKDYVLHLTKQITSPDDETLKYKKIIYHWWLLS